MLQHAIHFITANNESIIQWLVFTVIVLSLALVGLSLFSKAEKSDLGLSSAELENKLKALLQNAGTGIGLGSGAASGPEGTAGQSASGVGGPAQVAGSADVEKIKAELDLRTTEVKELKATLEKSKTESADISPYLKENKDLKARLAEYEILEDDIADLSLYKDENARLKAEIAQLKAGGAVSGAAVAAAPPPAATSVAEPEQDSEAALAALATMTEVESEPAADAQQGAELDAGPQAASESPTAGDNSDDLVAEFQAAVDGQKRPAGEKVAESAPADAPPASTGMPPIDGDDLMTEFAASLEEDTSALGDGLDADKMLAEVAALEGLDAGDVSTLEEEADIDKMAAEATSLSDKG